MSVLCRKTFDTRVEPLRNNLTLLAEKAVGRDDAPDVVQETLCTAWHDVGRFNAANEQPALLAWLQSILAFKVSEHICKEAFHRESALPATTLLEMCDGPGALAWEAEGWQAQRAELTRRLHNATLTDRQREYALRWVAGETLEAIGATQPVPVSPAAVHDTIQRVKRQLRDLEDVDAYDPRLGEAIQNLPAALSYLCQVQFWNRVRREANLYAMRRTVRRSYAKTGGGK